MTRLFYSRFYVKSIFTFSLSRQRVDEFEIEHDLVDGQVLVT